MEKSYPNIYRKTFITGRIDGITKKAFDFMYEAGCRVNQPIEDIFADIPDHTYMPNALRFLVSENYFEGMDGVFFNDVDLLLFAPQIFDWHILQMQKLETCYAAHHSAWRRPYRPEICGKNGWRGKFERIVGGFLYVTPEWFEKTRSARAKILKNINNSTLSGAARLYGYYRESDEVMLCDIMRASGLPVPKSKAFPPELRGIHLGDFKESMNHRWHDNDKMAVKLTMDNCLAYRRLSKDETWKGLLKIVCEDQKIKNIFANLESHLKTRGF